ncbi:MAG: hypothetical protein KKH52_04100 [Nanoarchaeota archaeon]|nr:hypothetical protein [Nanoarchaeota archaeon]MBU1622011.1 hypothetical protein [Nanoarchaeota archaeon]MBU1974552.1 hypothetical protein [Nanoarchaeota archaeon]
MDDLDISKALERKEEQQEQAELKESIEPDLGAEAGDTKNILIGILVIIGLLAVSFGGFKVYDHFTSAEVLNVDQLHLDNLEGQLDEEEGYLYAGYSFIKADGLWWTEIQIKDKLLKIPLHFGPQELGEIEISGKLAPKFNLGNKVYIAIDPKVQNKYYTLSISELSFNMAKGIDRIPIGSCTEENWACENRTIVSCADNPDDLPTVELVLAEEAKIELEDTCIKISGNDYDLVKATDRLLYQWYGIMD